MNRALANPLLGVAVTTVASSALAVVLTPPDLLTFIIASPPLAVAAGAAFAAVWRVGHRGWTAALGGLVLVALSGGLWWAAAADPDSFDARVLALRAASALLAAVSIGALIASLQVRARAVG